MSKLLIFALIFPFQSIAQINEQWIKEDSLFIKQVINKLDKTPENIHKILKPDNSFFQDLGYGYSNATGSNGKGYVSFFYNLIFKNKKLISFSLKSQLPNEKQIRDRYIKIYGSNFKFDSSRYSKTYYWNYGLACKPIISDSLYTHQNDSTLCFLMSPYSGINYGDYAGWGSRLKNRIIFESIQDQLNCDSINNLLLSINPATRLYAAEYYLTYSDKFKDPIVRKIIDDRIESMLNNTPNVKVNYADMIINENAKYILDVYVKKNKK